MASIKPQISAETKRILKAMFMDTKNVQYRMYPSQERDKMWIMEEMREIYLYNPSPSSLARFNSYKNKNQSAFLSQPGEIIICNSCGSHCYCIGKLNRTPICSQCQKDNTVLIDITVKEIPPWIDIDTFHWVRPVRADDYYSDGDSDLDE